jgi:predicted nucleic-acid-binding protein
MKALDTNLLVRFLVRDDEQQAMAVYRKFRQCKDEGEVIYVPALVVLETIWVLESVYAIARYDILDAIEQLLLMPILKFEVQEAIRNFVSAAHACDTDLSDLLTAHCAAIDGCECVLTFDKKAAEYELFELLE